MRTFAIVESTSVSVLPADHIDRIHFQLTVEYRGRDLYAVMHMRMCLGADGEWDFEPIPSERDDEWLATHRFPHAVTLGLAVKHCPDITVNGHTAREVAAS